MPAHSINSRQKRFLSGTTGIRLEDIGEAKSSAEPLELDAVESMLLDMATLFKTLAEKGLSVKDAVDTGKLADSIQFEAVKYLGGVYAIDIKVLDYYAFISQGVKGTQNKSINSPFGFKNNFVGKAMLFSIRKWLIRHGLKASAKPALKSPLGTEKKASPFKDAAKSNALAYAVATNIKKRGIKPTHFWEDAERGVRESIEKQAGNAFTIDIINALSK